MRAIIFSTRPYESERYQRINLNRHTLEITRERLTSDTAALAKGYEAVIVFVSDDLSTPVIEKLGSLGIKLIVCRSAGYDHVDCSTAKKLGITVANCPRYSPSAVAEFAVGLLLALDRKIVLAHEQIARHDFTIDNLLGFEISTSTVGIIGTGHIGAAFAQIMKGFGCTLLAYDPFENPECIKLGVKYCSLDTLFAKSDVISLHTPLLESTYHLINDQTINQMKPGVLLVNTARGAVIDTYAVITGIEKGQIGGFAADVYEYERGLFFEDYSNQKLNEPLLEKLLSMQRVLLTPHQAFFTEKALENITKNVFENLDSFEKTGTPTYVLP